MSEVKKTWMGRGVLPEGINTKRYDELGDKRYEILRLEQDGNAGLVYAEYGNPTYYRGCKIFSLNKLMMTEWMPVDAIKKIPFTNLINGQVPMMPVSEELKKHILIEGEKPPLRGSFITTKKSELAYTNT